jgi:hypothetical protein
MSKIIRKHPLFMQLAAVFLFSVIAAVLTVSGGDVLMITGDGTASSTIDNAISNRVVNLGYTVVLKEDNLATTNDAANKVAIYISESSASGVLTNRFKNVAVPLMTSEFNIFDDLDMTGDTISTHFGTNTLQTNMAVLVSGHPLTAGLSTVSPLATTSKTIIWGVPSTNAVIAATLYGNTNRATVFGYEVGKAMEGTTAPERRTGFFMDRTAANDFSTDAWRLFDSALMWTAGERPILLVSADGTSTTRPQEIAMVERLEYLGYKVIHMTDNAATTADAGGKVCVIISGSCNQTLVNTNFRDVTVPVITMNRLLYDDMMLTGPTSGTDYGSNSEQQYTDMSDTAHPIASGLTGDDVRINTIGVSVSWAIPGSGSRIVSKLRNSSTKALIFTYDSGSSMVGMNAPARRAGFYWIPHDTELVSNTSAGWALFDATVDWAARSIPALFVVSNPSSLTSGDQVALDRLQQLGLDVETADDDGITAVRASGKALVAISSSIVSTSVTNIFRTTAIPVVCMERAIWDDMAMVTSGNFGIAATGTNLVVASSWHAVAGRNQDGTNSYVTSTVAPLWGGHLSTGTSIAHVPGNTSQSIAFVYEAGTLMDGSFPAPARRVGLGYREDGTFGTTGSNNLKASGWAIFDAAIRWAIGASSTLTDADADGLPDSWEELYWGSITAYNGSSDPDGDGRTNAAEYAGGTNPTVMDFLLTLSVNDTLKGNVAGGVSGVYYASNSLLYLNPIPYTTNAFDNWSGSLTGSAKPGQVLMTNNMTITASFSRDTENPVMAFTSPSTSPYISSQPLLTVAGTSTDFGNMSEVRVKNLTRGTTNWVASGTTSWTISNIPLSAGTNIVHVSGTDANGNVGTNVTTVIYSAATNTAPWSSVDIGTVSAVGSSRDLGDNKFSVDGSGADIFGTSDEFRYMYRAWTNDMQITAKVDYLENENDIAAKAGIMIRETLTGGSKHASLVMSAGNGVRFIRRSSTGGSTANVGDTGLSAPYWLRLKRAGNVFSAYRSADGYTWSQVSTNMTVSMNGALQVGLAVTSHDDGRLILSKFSNVSITSTAFSDGDSDGMDDAWETSYFGGTSQVAADDYDEDGLTNLEEFQLGTNPILADGNSNGLNDKIDITLGFDPNGSDTDGDGVPNATELANGTNPLSADTDGDGYADGVDAFPLDPTAHTAPGPTGGDSTPPVITLTEPSSAF